MQRTWRNMMQGNPLPVSHWCRAACLLAVVVILEPPRLLSQSAAPEVPAGRLQCYFACVGHEGEVVQCLDGRRRPTTLTCSPTPDPSEAPSRSITTTPSPCAIPYRSALRLHPTNPRYFQDVATSAPVLIASYAN